MARSKFETNVKPKYEFIAAWCRDGVTERNMAKNCGVGWNTWNEYKKKHKDFQDLLTRTKAYVDEVVVTNAYLKRITGYDTREYRMKFEYDEEGNKIYTGGEEFIKHVPGDPRGMENWLRLRQPEKWAQKPEGEEEEGNGFICLPQKKEPDMDTMPDFGE